MLSVVLCNQTAVMKLKITLQMGCIVKRGSIEILDYKVIIIRYRYLCSCVNKNVSKSILTMLNMFTDVHQYNNSEIRKV